MKTATFYKTDYCSNCKVLLPRIQEMVPDIKVKTLFDEDPAIEAYGIRSVPTIIVFDDGLEVTRISGGTLSTIRKFFSDNGLL